MVKPQLSLLAVPAAAALSFGLAACTSGGSASGGSASGGSSSGGSSAHSSAVTPTHTATASVTETAPAASGSSGAGSDGGAPGDGSGGGGGGAAAAGASECAENQLRAAIDPRPVSGSSTHGDYAVIVDFTNTSSHVCVIHGYPGAALVDSSGKQVKQAQRSIRGKLLGLPQGQDSLPTVTLQPGAVASAGLEGVNQQETGAAQAGCDEHYSRILVTPPNTKTPVPFDANWPVCYSFGVHPTNIENNPPH